MEPTFKDAMYAVLLWLPVQFLLLGVFTNWFTDLPMSAGLSVVMPILGFCLLQVSLGIVVLYRIRKSTKNTK